MTYYVRKFARAKWCLLDNTDDDSILNYRADTIANDLKTTNNSLSIWKAASLENDDLEPIVLVNSLMSDKIRKIDLLCIPDSIISSYSLVQEDGDTVVDEYRNSHYNITSLTIKRLIDFADKVVLKIIKNESGTIVSVTVPEQLEIIIRWIRSGKLSFDDLKDTQKEAVKKQLAKFKLDS